MRDSDHDGYVLDQGVRVKLSEMKTTDQLITEQMTDLASRAECERTVLARAVALRLVRYRSEHALSQRDLAKLLDMEQPQIARLERGDVNPTLETLMRLAGALEIEFTIDVRPTTRKARLVTKRAQDDTLTSYATDRAVALVAAG